MRARRKYTVIYERDEAGWWVASLREIAGCHTQGRTIGQARERAREALSLFIGDAAEKVSLVDDVHLPAPVLRKVLAANLARERAGVEAENAGARSREAVRALIEQGLSARDAGELLGITRQRANQLARTG